MDIPGKLDVAKIVKLCVGAVAVAAMLAGPLAYADEHASVRLPSSAKLVGHVAPATRISFALTLPLRDPHGLNDFIERLNDPADPEYHHYLTPEQFADRFGPTQAEYDALQSAASYSGLTVERGYKSRTIVDVSAPASIVESTFGVRLNAYADAAGRSYHVPDRTLQLPSKLSDLGASVVGLDNAPVARPHFRLNATLSPSQSLTPVGFSPAQIKKAYNIPTSLTGAGQTIALMELDGYKASDIQQYRNQWGITGTPIENIMVDSASGAAGSGANEVVLDIDMVLAMANNATALLVYEAPNTGQGALDAYARIANDNRAKVASTSWGLAETAQSRSLINSEATVFAQMVAQGQAMFSASGDLGAFDDPNAPSTLSVDDPASQPNVTGVGGTTLNVDVLGNYVSETTWNNGPGSAGGGGVSQIWPMPSYQKNAGLIGSNRLVPDVSFNADPNTGYAIYFTDPINGAGWEEAAGTSAAAPLWAGLTALINQQLAAKSLGLLGFANPPIYKDASTPAKYARDFHDIADGSSNLHYTAQEGFDEATGWGTPIGSMLINDLTTPTSATTTTVHTFTSGIKLFSIPYEYEGLAVSSIFDQPVTLYYWDPLTLAYVASPNPPVDTVHQMIAYWARFTTNTNVKIAGTDLTSGQTGLTIELQSGWNQFGNPYNLTVPLSDVTITPITGGSAMSLASANSNGYVYATLFSYDPSTNQYVPHSSDSLTPFTGYWIKAFQPCKVTVTHP
jgi:kumamolisin